MIIDRSPRPSGKRAPYGFTRIDGILQPNNELLDLLETAFEKLNNGLSLRSVTDWLVNTSGVIITHGGLRRLWFEYYPEKLKAVVPRNKVQRSLDEVKKRNRLLKIAQEKKKITYAKKKIDSLGGQIEKIKEEEKKHVEIEGVREVTELDYTQLTPTNKRKLVFEPNPGPQTEFLAASEQEVLYGGAAGGGKSYALIADPMRYFYNPEFNGLILRRTNDELRGLIWKAQLLYKQAFGDKIRWGEKKSAFQLPGGGSLWFTYIEQDQDAMRYQGQDFCYIAFDELTQHPTPYLWNYMRSRLRTSEDSGLPLLQRGTTNPGGPGHGWVKRMFVDPAPSDEAFWAKDLETNETLQYPKGHRREGQPLFQRRFIPARVQDNPFLWNDGNYEANLLSLPEAQKRQLLDGDWNSPEGAAFPEFKESIHVIKPIKIEPAWRKFRSCDFGYSSASAVHWYAVDNENRLYVYRELYVSKMTGKDLALKILEIENKAEEKVTYGVLDSSVWAKRGESGPSIAEEMIATGCRWRPSDRSNGSRSAGKNRLHELLKVDEGTSKPGIYFFNTCRQIIADLQVIPVDPNGEDDINDKYATDHAYDSIRYGIMSRPRPGSLDDMITIRKGSHHLPSDSKFGY